MKNKVSLIIITHNQSKILELQLASIAIQCGLELKDFEVIVSDDSSSLSELKAIQRLVEKQLFECKLITQHSDRYWVAAARNNGINASTGNILIFLDGDMVPEIDFISSHFFRQISNDKLVIAGNRQRRTIKEREYNTIESFLEICRQEKLINDEKKQRWQTAEEKKRIEFINSQNSWRVAFGCNISIKKNDEVYFDERFKGWGPEDLEFSHRLFHRFGYNFIYDPKIIAYEVDYLGGGVSNVFRNQSDMAIIDFLRNCFLFYEICPKQNIEDVFWGLRKLNLNGNTWEVIPPDNYKEMQELVEIARKWLIENNHYIDITNVIIKDSQKNR